MYSSFIKHSIRQYLLNICFGDRTCSGVRLPGFKFQLCPLELEDLRHGLNLSKFQSLYVEYSLRELQTLSLRSLGGLNEIVHVKQLTRCLPYSELSINGTYYVLKIMLGHGIAQKMFRTLTMFFNIKNYS